MNRLICIRCPRGCHLEIDGNNVVTGNRCPRGEEYALKELLNPTRTLTSTVRIRGSAIRRLPVKSAEEIPKVLLMDAIRQLDGIAINAPVQCGQVILEDIMGTGVPLIATRSIPHPFP